MSAGPQVQSLTCPNCGAPLPVRCMGRAVSIVCERCQAILDAHDPKLAILQRFQAQAGDPPLIPLGTRAKWRGADYEAVGFQRRTIVVDEISYTWQEYVVFNPYKGYRYFTEYEGHWNDTSTTTALPEVAWDSAKYLGTKYKHFQTAQAATTVVLGEFPWRVTVGEKVEVADYVAPPFVLSSEQTADQEVTWSLGEYVHGEDIWKAFGLAGVPPTPIGVYENQPTPLRITSGQIWFTFANLAAALFLIFMLSQVFGQRAEVFNASYDFAPSTGEASFVTPVFELKGRTTSVEVKSEAGLANQWIYLNYALIDDDTGKAYDFGRELSYYYGTDSDGAWEEGNRADTVLLPSVPAGRYYLRIEPESDPNTAPIDYAVTVTRDVPSMALYLAAMAAILIPALFLSWRIFNFEQLRWAESDHPIKIPHASSGGGE